MPKFLLPWKDSSHRIAAKALYRALLLQCPRSGLELEQQQQISNVVRNRFKENRYNHSKKQLPVLFKAGYSAIDHLDAAAAGVETSRTYLLDLLTRAPAKAKRPPYQAPLVHETTATDDETPTIQRRSIWDRPLPLSELSGRRHIPRLVSAGNIPMLRIKKPQPAALSAYIRHRIMKKDGRHRVIRRLASEVTLASREDDWDELISEHAECTSHEQASIDEGPWWTESLDLSSKVLEAANRRDAAKNADVARRMQHIVDMEKQLARQEKEDRRRAYLEGRTVVNTGSLTTNHERPDTDEYEPTAFYRPSGNA